MLTLNQIVRLNTTRDNEAHHSQIIHIPETVTAKPSGRLLVCPEYNGPRKGWYEYYEAKLSNWSACERNQAYGGLLDWII